jgi:M-phase inducer tyrosine phosphatase
MRPTPPVQPRHVRQQKRDQPFCPLPSAMPSLFPSHTASRFLQVPSLPARKAPIPNESFDDISDDLELSFASNMSLNPTTTEERNNHVVSPVPMDISPAPPSRVAPPKFTPRPRAFTSSARLFGRDVSNENSQPPSISAGTGSGTTSGKKLQRAALPFEWMAPSHPEQSLDTPDSSQMVRISFAQLVPI